MEFLSSSPKIPALNHPSAGHSSTFCLCLSLSYYVFFSCLFRVSRNLQLAKIAKKGMAVYIFWRGRRFSNQVKRKTGISLAESPALRDWGKYFSPGFKFKNCSSQDVHWRQPPTESHSPQTPKLLANKCLISSTTPKYSVYCQIHI